MQKERMKDKQKERKKERKIGTFSWFVLMHVQGGGSQLRDQRPPPSIDFCQFVFSSQPSSSSSSSNCCFERNKKSCLRQLDLLLKLMEKNHFSKSSVRLSSESKIIFTAGLPNDLFKRRPTETLDLKECWLIPTYLSVMAQWFITYVLRGTKTKG